VHDVAGLTFLLQLSVKRAIVLDLVRRVAVGKRYGRRYQRRRGNDTA